MDCMIRFAYCVFSLLLLSISVIWAVPPVLNYAGQVAVNGQAFDGEGRLKFALVSPDGNFTHWSQDGTSVGGSEPGESCFCAGAWGALLHPAGQYLHSGHGCNEPLLISANIRPSFTGLV